MRKVVIAALISIFLFSTVAIGADTLRTDRLKEGFDNIGFGLFEMPDNVNVTKTKGTPAFPDCTDKTKDDVGRMIVRVVGGLFQIATFWIPPKEKPAVAAQAKSVKPAVTTAAPQPTAVKPAQSQAIK